MPQPWTKEDCYNRYCHGKQISLRRLAVESGVTAKRLYDWSRAENWVEDRKRIRSKTQAEAEAKAIEKASDRLSDLAVAHLKSYSTARQVIDHFFNWQSSRLQEVCNIPEHLEAEIKAIHPAAINHWLQALERAINGERTAAGMEWESVPKAISFLHRQGYEIVDPNIKIEKESEEFLGLSDDAADLIKSKILDISIPTAPGELVIERPDKNRTG